MPSKKVEVSAIGSVIDVREAAAHADEGIVGSINIPLKKLAGSATFLRTLPSPFVTCGQDPHSSSRARSIIVALGMAATDGGHYKHLAASTGRKLVTANSASDVHASTIKT